jgi:electron transfer flavoprotein beta subunit
VRFGVCLKLQDRRPEIDPLTGATHHDARFTGLSDADLAAVEWALRCADAWGGEVLAVSAGGPHADGILHFALGNGARALRVEMPPGAPSDVVATALAPALEACDLVWCGDQSLDRGTGAVPAFLAARLGAAQALGLVGVEIQDAPGELVVTRRLDGGRRERLRVHGPAVLSVEGSTARLRRASVGHWLSARRGEVTVQPGPPVHEHGSRTSRPFRPRARALPAPRGATALERIEALTDMHLGGATTSAAVTLEPAEAAARILAALSEWGYTDA